MEGKIPTVVRGLTTSKMLCRNLYAGIDYLDPLGETVGHQYLQEQENEERAVGRGNCLHS